MVTKLYGTERLMAAERFTAWQEMCSQSAVPLALKAEHPSSFNAHSGNAELGSAVLQTLRFSSHRASRTPALIRRSDPEACAAVLVVRGTLGVEQAGTSSLVPEGDLVLYDSSYPFSFQAGDGPGLTEVLLVRVPKRLLPARDERLKQLVACRLSGSRGFGALTAQTMAAARRQMQYCSAADAARLGVVLTDLVSALIGHHLDEPGGAPPAESGADMVLLAIENFIAQHLHDPDLGPGTVASAHHISVRYLHHLFERRDTTVAAYIRRQRLEMVRRELADPARGDVPIHAVARRWGFPDQAALSRAFRGAYGETPRDYRKSVLRPGVVAGWHAGV